MVPEAVPSPTITEVARRWGISLESKFDGAWCSEVWAGRDSAGRDVVLKIPHDEETESIPTVVEFSGLCGVEVLRCDEETFAILMPRLRPGSTLAEAGLPDVEALKICASLITQLRLSSRRPATDMESWFERFLRIGPQPAVRLCRHMIDTTSRWTLLHGDLHHGNILRRGDDWVVIDPKGLWGDPAFEPCAYIRNPIDWVLADPDPLETADRRVRMFAELLGDEIERVWGWAYVQTSECAFTTTKVGEAWQRVTDALWEVGESYRDMLGFS